MYVLLALAAAARARTSTHRPLEVSRPRAVTGGPVARSPVRGPGRAQIFWLRAGTGRPGRPKKTLTGYGRPWITFLARKVKKYKNSTKILIFSCYTENISW